MPNKRKRLSASERRSSRKDGIRRLQTRLVDATEACGTASRFCRQLEDENRILTNAAGCPYRCCDCDRHQQACSLPADPNLIPSIMETIALSVSACLSASGASGDHHPAPDASPGLSDDLSHYSPVSGGCGSPSGSPSSASGSPTPRPPCDPPRDQPQRRPSPPVSWPGSPPSSPGG